MDLGLLECFEIQKNELEALKAIYMDDFVYIDNNTFSHASNDQESFLKIHLHSDFNGVSFFSLDLIIYMTDTYPKTRPRVSIDNSVNLLKSQLAQIDDLILKTMNKLEGHEMIYEISSNIQDILYEWQNEYQPSTNLGEERHLRILKEELKQQLTEEEMRKQQEYFKKEEEIILDEMIRKELIRRKGQLTRVNKRQQDCYGFQEPSDDIIIFDKEIEIQNEQCKFIRFQAVKDLLVFRKQSFMTVKLVTPVTDKNRENIFVLKDLILNSEFWNSSDGTKEIYKMEEELQATISLRHPSIVQFYACRISLLNSGSWRLSCLQEYTPRGSLRDILENVGSVSLDIARSWAMDLLEGINEAHRRGFLHKNLHLGNILIFKSEKGRSVAKISDYGISYSLQHMNKLCSFSSNESSFSKKNNIPKIWYPPECKSETGNYVFNRKSDIWMFGVIFLQMIFGINSTSKYSSLKEISDSMVSVSVIDFLNFTLEINWHKRPSASDLLASPFFTSGEIARTLGLNTEISTNPFYGFVRASKYNSQSSRLRLASRYENDFEEVKWLGKGTYGKVIKVRNRLDGQYYAIKRISLNKNEYNRILREVMTLSRLHHQHIVRYFSAWLEDLFSGETIYDHIPRKFGRSIDSYNNGSDLISSNVTEFVSSSRPERSFLNCFEGEISRSTSSNWSSCSINSEISVDLKSRSSGILYIQMEYCERRTLKDILELKQVNTDEIWRLFRQILDALVHIHGQGVIHRDLKPSNIFLDENGDVKIGDFGLATECWTIIENLVSRKYSDNIENDNDLTSGIGTALYIAPELLEHNTKHSYNQKVDMYSLGIILFELCYPFKTTMERIKTILNLRDSNIIFPSKFPSNKFSNQKHIITWLLQHDPKTRPTSFQLLRSELLPPKVEDEYIRESLHTLANPNTPYYVKLMEALFSQNIDKCKDYTYDIITDSLNVESPLMEWLKSCLVTIFKRHGAISNNDRSQLFPKNEIYNSGQNLATFLDCHGTLLQLPYDLILPFARQLTKCSLKYGKYYCFGKVYRNSTIDTIPWSLDEVNFDIVTRNDDNLSLYESECIKILDEIINEVPSLLKMKILININHCDILDCIFDYCGIDISYRPRASILLSQLGKSATLKQIQNQLRSESLLSGSSLEQLDKFNFQDEFEAGILRLLNIFDVSMHQKLLCSIENIRSVFLYLKYFHIEQEIFLFPLTVHNYQFYKGGLIFEALMIQNKKCDIFAAGGRYDSLINQCLPPLSSGKVSISVVGITIFIEKIISSLAKFSFKEFPSRKYSKAISGSIRWPYNVVNCDVLVSSIGHGFLKECLEILNELWKFNIKSDLSRSNLETLDDIIDFAKKNGVNWIIIVRHKSYEANGLFKDYSVKVKNIASEHDEEIPYSSLVPWLLGEIAERNRQNISENQIKFNRINDENMNDMIIRKRALDVNFSRKKELSVRFLSEENTGKIKLKKKQFIINKAYEYVSELINDICSRNIVVFCVDLSDNIYELIKNTNLQENQWRKVIDATPAHQRQYVHQLWTSLKDIQNELGHQRAWLYTFRANKAFLYDFL
ncbi:hypothetical protein T552_02554 [Pneumocystis carinii B80]|uniref:non-specific serine/threonine protein kinase n=1 Tax=Pneumocystis carinii (strain B80) TaxID=1408658 RepID=A0A0W4ZFD0_PNEC8|nr:hypothetical protein T552_02554 [Pneumocystis carinii B80]KTW27062.1 hypothetical protein T552_02554 [Pneumocystis carinii B80]